MDEKQDAQPVTVVTPPEQVPEEESRGGDKPDWKNAKPGERLPEFPSTVAGAAVTIKPDYDEPEDEAS